jgi:hypothetical protein
MTGEAPNERSASPTCRWRTSAETLDVIEALERIEALLVRLDERARSLTAADAEGTHKKRMEEISS